MKPLTVKILMAAVCGAFAVIVLYILVAGNRSAKPLTITTGSVADQAKQQPISSMPMPMPMAAPPPVGAPVVRQPTSPPTGDVVFLASPENTQDIWTTSVYSYAPGGGGPGGGLDNDQLRVGGWGDWYWSLMRFNLSNYPKQATHAVLELYNEDTNTAPTPVFVFVIDQDWGWTKGDRLWWSNRPTEMHRAVYVDAPPSNSWISFDITDIYNAWQSGRTQNFGIALLPVLNNNNFDRFRSSKYPDESYRPKLIIVPAQTANSGPPR